VRAFGYVQSARKIMKEAMGGAQLLWWLSYVEWRRKGTHHIQ
jgi:hypothetical protein